MSSKGRQKTAIVVGAGIGGLATAARLAKAGFKVTVLEKNDFAGGRCSLIENDGYRFDQGPSLVLLPPLFKECFADLDTTMEAEGIRMVRCDPNYYIYYSDGERMEMSCDLEKMKGEIEKYEGKDGYERYLGFLQESHRHYELANTHILHKNFPTLFSLARFSIIKVLYKLHTLESMWSRAAKYFYTERLRRAFTFHSMYIGMSPFEAPATYSLLQYTEFAEGIWYPIGGFHMVAQALVNIGKRLGVEYRFSTPVSSINLTPDQKRATGVVLPTGRTLNADIVICNADIVWAYNHLLPPTEAAHKMTTRKSSSSSLSFYWGLDTTVLQLAPHNIFLADDYRDSFDGIFKHNVVPEEPSFYVHCPSRVDPSAAPPGKDAICILAPVGHLPDSASTGEEQDWPTLIASTRAKILHTLSARLGVDIEKHIVSESINDPRTWRERFNLDRGAILGLAHNFFNVLSFRPRTRHPSIRDLYFVGASTHPGTGVPIVMAGAKVTAEQVLGDLGMEVPWAAYRGDVQRDQGNHLDKMGGPGVDWVLLGVVGVVLAGLWSSFFLGGAGGGMGIGGPEGFNASVNGLLS